MTRWNAESFRIWWAHAHNKYHEQKNMCWSYWKYAPIRDEQYLRYLVVEQHPTQFCHPARLDIENIQQNGKVKDNMRLMHLDEIR